MLRIRKSLTVVALTFGMIMTSMPAAHASDSCMPRVDLQYLVGDVVDCVKDVIIPLIDWPPTA